MDLYPKVQTNRLVILICYIMRMLYQGLRIPFFLDIKKYCFLHKAMEKPYLNLHFKFHDFFP